MVLFQNISFLMVLKPQQKKRFKQNLLNCKPTTMPNSTNEIVQ